MKLLSIVIPVWNNLGFTKKCLEDLRHLSDDHEIIIVDDSSTDGTTNWLSEQEDIVHITAAQNGGFAKSCNKGYQVSSGQFVMFLNNDIRVKKDKETWTKPIIEAAKSGGLVGPTVGVLDGTFGFICESNKMPTRGIPYMSGWNLTASRDTWEKLILPEYVGPFSEEYGRAFFEDSDLSFRARELKIPFKIVSVPIHHFGHRTTNKVNTSALYKEARGIFIRKWGKVNQIFSS